MTREPCMINTAIENIKYFESLPNLPNKESDLKQGPIHHQPWPIIGHVSLSVVE